MSRVLGAAAVLVLSISVGYCAMAVWDEVVSPRTYQWVDTGR